MRCVAHRLRFKGRCLRRALRLLLGIRLLRVVRWLCGLNRRCRRAWLCRRIRRLILVLTRRVLLVTGSRRVVHFMNTQFTYAFVFFDILVIQIVVVTSRLHAF